MSRSWTWALCIASLAMLCACGDSASSQGALETEAAHEVAASEPARPVLIPAGLDIVPELQKAGPPWDAEPFYDRNSYTGGSVDLSRRTVMFPMGSIIIDRPASGGIYLVTVRSGMGDRCGDPSALGRAYAALAGPLEIPLPDEKQLAQIQNAWLTDDGFTEVEFPHAMVRAIGGCISAMVIKATA